MENVAPFTEVVIGPNGQELSRSHTLKGEKKSFNVPPIHGPNNIRTHTEIKGHSQDAATAQGVAAILEKHGGDLEKAKDDLKAFAETVPAHVEVAPDTVTQDGEVAMRLYLLRLCQYGRGDFEGLDSSALLDITKLIPAHIKANDIVTWIKLMAERDGDPDS